MCAPRLDPESGGVGNYYKVYYLDSLGNLSMFRLNIIIVKFLGYENGTLVMLGNVLILRRYQHLDLRSQNDSDLFSSKEKMCIEI